MSSPGAADARGAYVSQIPNAPNSCNTCHTAGGGTPRNAFGQDIENTLSGRTVNWAAVCMRDSDNDTFSNGVELADPNCSWRTGDPIPTGPVSAPGNPRSVPPPPDAGVVDMGPPDTGIPPDSGLAPDLGVPDMGPPDTGPDLGPPDTGVSPDAGMPADTGVLPDVGPSPDAGPEDVGLPGDAGPADTGLIDRAVGGGCRGTSQPGGPWPLLVLALGLFPRRRAESRA